MNPSKPLISDYKKAELEGLHISFFENNRKNFIKNLNTKITGIQDKSLLFLKGGVELFKYDNDDDYHYFMQESNFYYLTGVREPNFYATIDLKDGNLCLFIALPDERTKIFFHVETWEDIKKKYNADVFELEQMPEKIKKLEPPCIYVLSGTNSDSGWNVLTCDYTFPAPYQELNSWIDYEGLVYEVLADTRTVKTDEEWGLLQFLNNVTIKGHLNVMQNIKPGQNERHVENYFWSWVVQETYARNHPYDHICGCGEHSATLHYNENNTELKDGQWLLMDMGCKICGYTSDVTSTIPVNGVFTQKQKEIYDIVLKANRTIIETAKPAESWVSMHLLAETEIWKGLVNIGLLNGEAPIEELQDKRICYYFMPHGLGHLMGLEVHDVGGYLSYTEKRSEKLGLNLLRSARTLSVGMVVTVEPGIYFIPFLLEKAFADQEIAKYFNKDKIKTYYDFGGVRIEDNIYITESGCVNMTQDWPRTTEEIENAMKRETK